MKVSFAVTCHNESDSLARLLEQLVSFIEDNENEDEIVILDDFSTDKDALMILNTYEEEYPFISVHQRALERDFGAQKTHLNSLCSGDYIFQIDADELLAPELLDTLHDLLKSNLNIDLYFLPRINTVEGLTDTHIREWGWKVNDKGWVLWPDWQGRLYRNRPDIIWRGRVHERIDGHELFAQLPAEESYCILHYKNISKQEQQNAFYSQILSMQDSE